jgi:hypothetical protein
MSKADTVDMTIAVAGGTPTSVYLTNIVVFDSRTNDFVTWERTGSQDEELFVARSQPWDLDTRSAGSNFRVSKPIRGSVVFAEHTREPSRIFLCYKCALRAIAFASESFASKKDDVAVPEGYRYITNTFLPGSGLTRYTFTRDTTDPTKSGRYPWIDNAKLSKVGTWRPKPVTVAVLENERRVDAAAAAASTATRLAELATHVETARKSLAHREGAHRAAQATLDNAGTGITLIGDVEYDRLLRNHNPCTEIRGVATYFGIRRCQRSTSLV